MAARDIYHDNLKSALIKDGWTITHDPLPLKYGKRTLLVDLGAERLITAEKGGRKIAVEGKSFVGRVNASKLTQSRGNPKNILKRSLVPANFQAKNGGNKNYWSSFGT